MPDKAPLIASSSGGKDSLHDAEKKGLLLGAVCHCYSAINVIVSVELWLCWHAATILFTFCPTKIATVYKT